MEKRLKIVGDSYAAVNYRVFLDDVDISEMVRGLTINMNAGEVNTAELRLIATSFEVEGMFDVTSIKDEARRYIKE